MAYGMTPQGFVPPRLAELLEELYEAFGEITHPDTGEKPFANISDDAIWQQIVAVFADALATCWSALDSTYRQGDPRTNTGAAQAAMVQLNGVLKQWGTPTVVKMELIGEPGATIKGTRITDRTEQEIFETNEAVTLGTDGRSTVAATRTRTGEFDPAPGSIFMIQGVVPGLYEARNTDTLSKGREEETEEELRIRQQNSTAMTSNAAIEAIQSALANVPGVTFARAYQNTDTFPADDRGIPYKRVAAVVEGGDQREVARTLFFRLPPGELGWGNTTEVFTGARGGVYPVSFSRPGKIEIYVEVEVQKEPPGFLPENADELIIKNILEFAARGDEGFPGGFTAGRTVLRPRLCTPVNRVPGHRINHILIGTSPLVGEDDIPIAWNQVAAFAAERIGVTVV